MNAQDLAKHGLIVKPLEWMPSKVSSWNGDFHTVPTGYTVRCADENGWKWTGIGVVGYAPSAKSAQLDAEKDHFARICAALEAKP